MNALSTELGVTGWQALSLVIGATVLFWVFTLLISFFGHRLRAGLTGSSVALMMLIGAVAARAMLGPDPTMTAGLIVLAVLFCWEAIFGLLSHMRGAPWAHREAHAVIQHGVIDEAALHQVHLKSPELIVRLRQAGITRLEDVGLAIVERDGSLTIIRAGQPVDAQFLTGVADVQ